MEDPRNPADGKHVVIQGGQRVTGALSQAEAEQEAQRRNQLAESSGQPVPENQRAEAKQNIFG